MCYKILKDQEKEKLTKCIFHWHEYFSVAAASTECYQSGLECFFLREERKFCRHLSSTSVCAVIEICL